MNKTMKKCNEKGWMDRAKVRDTFSRTGHPKTTERGIETYLLLFRDWNCSHLSRKYSLLDGWMNESMDKSEVLVPITGVRWK